MQCFQYCECVINSAFSQPMSKQFSRSIAVLFCWDWVTIITERVFPVAGKDGPVCQFDFDKSTPGFGECGFVFVIFVEADPAGECSD